MMAAGRYVEVPGSLHPPIEQAAIVIASTRAQALARRFLAFLRRADSAARLHASGFGEATR
jgi:ABC-type molybdate transport system substrate-binding protein